jgi:hypothetical protein
MAKMNPLKIDKHGSQYRDCHVQICKGHRCQGTIHVWERVKYQSGKLLERSEPWVSCTESRYCGFYRSYRESEWGPA